MMARTQEIRLPSGAALQTPLLVPSFSSRGFDLLEGGLSEASVYLQAVQEHLTESLLVSAYDLHHQMMPQVNNLLSDRHWDSIWATPALLVVDSGGYELGNVWDGTEVRRGERKPLEFQRQDFHALVDMLPRDRDFLVVTWDHVSEEIHQLSLSEQVRTASEFRDRYPEFMVDFLLKPEKGDRFIDPSKVQPIAATLAQFDVIGVTEKELGDSILDRAFNLLRIRRALDDAHTETPIHVFGALDPLFVRLYFMCGAEIFDGLTWLRYGIFKGVSMYREAAVFLSGEFARDESGRVARQQISYLRELKALKRELKSMSSSQDGERVPEVTREYALNILSEIQANFS
ncbi:hypothetical protein ACFZBZ_18650 [Streptomyces sp. NPDC008196]|uniref:hypothetical protein n=1 Tax=Streptomyces sp. NPDC008196 TaxID=3364819 RepID=UPI0036F07B2F